MDNRYLITVTPETIGEKTGGFYGRRLRKDGRLHEFEDSSNTYYICDKLLSSVDFVSGFYGIPCSRSRKGNLIFGKSPEGHTASCSDNLSDRIDCGVTYVILNSGRVLRVHVQSADKALLMADLSMRREARAEVEAAIAGAVPYCREAV